MRGASRVGNPTRCSRETRKGPSPVLSLRALNASRGRRLPFRDRSFPRRRSARALRASPKRSECDAYGLPSVVSGGTSAALVGRLRPCLTWIPARNGRKTPFPKLRPAHRLAGKTSGPSQQEVGSLTWLQSEPPFTFCERDLVVGDGSSSCEATPVIGDGPITAALSPPRNRTCHQALQAASGRSGLSQSDTLLTLSSDAGGAMRLRRPSRVRMRSIWRTRVCVG